MFLRQAVDDRRRHEVAVVELGTRQPLAADQDRAAVFLRLRDRAFVRLHRALVDHGAEPHVALERVADLDLLRLLDEQLDEPIADLPRDVHARAGGALLSLRAERGAHDAVARLLEIRGSHHDRGVLPPHLGDDRPRRPARRVVANQLHPDVVRAGEHDAVDAVVVDQFLTDRAAAARDEVEDALRDAGLVHDFGEPKPHVGRVGRRLEHDRVAGDERAPRRARGERHREVERRDHRPDAVRTEHAAVVLARTEGVHRFDEALVVLDLIAVVRHQVRGLLDVADTLETVLAGLEAHDHGQFPPVIADGIGRLAHEAHAFLPRQRGPRRKRRARRGDRLPHVVLRPALKLRDEDARVDRAPVFEFLVRLHRLSVDVHRPALAEGPPDARDLLVDRTVQIVHLVRAHRRIGDFDVFACRRFHQRPRDLETPIVIDTSA